MKRSNTVRRAGFLAYAGVVAFGLTACSEEDHPIVEERVRAIKPFTVTDAAGGDERRFTGSLVAANTSNLSFAKSGTVATVSVSQGDPVAAGQVLAKLDPEPLALALAGAKSELDSAAASAEEKKTALNRNQTLFEKGWVTKAALNEAIAAADAATAQLELARSRVASAERDLTQATLVAPFDGVIASRSVDAFEEVNAGATLFVLNSKDTLEATFNAPDAIVGRLTIGMTAEVNVATVDGCGCKARITEIGTASSTANAVQVKATIYEGAPALLPGMTASIRAVLSGGEGERGYLTPLTAIAPGDEAAPGYVFVFDRGAGAVRKTAIETGTSIEDNLVEIVKGVGPGDIIAAAGVSFLRDGQSVKLLGE
ncbi:MAG: efflux RND transporter periplasmic adaptor subunit [Neomegalonema sp.]|nr:efflux RND transporter periplasmic adaptor subunit [Neomegalonema sp.]